jgi:predicted transposase/invertase (TIGR01784 family)
MVKNQEDNTDNAIDHDGLFKQLLSTFFIEFIELFFPEILEYLDRKKLEFIDKELVTDVTTGNRKILDLLVKSRFQNQNYHFLIHVEHQSTNLTNFNRRMFHYFAELERKHSTLVYPIVIFSYDRPQRSETNKFIVESPNKKILEFNYDVIQLNRLNWRDFLQQKNPVAAALMAKMQVKPDERVTVKLECIRLLLASKLDSLKSSVVLQFIDNYLRLNQTEEQTFNAEIAKIEPKDREKVMAITTSWEEKGIKEGRRLELIESTLEVLEHQLTEISSSIKQKVKSLSNTDLKALKKAAWEMKTIEELESWFNQNQTNN